MDEENTITCPKCNGKGGKVFRKRNGDAHYVPCSECHGAGVIYGRGAYVRQLWSVVMYVLAIGTFAYAVASLVK